MHGYEDKYEYIYRCANWEFIKGNSSKPNAYLAEKNEFPWHGDVNNYLYCDGHLEARKPGTPKYGLIPDFEEFFEWYVKKSHARQKFEHAIK